MFPASVNNLQVHGSNLNFTTAALEEKIAFAEMALRAMKSKDIDEIREESEREMR